MWILIFVYFDPEMSVVQSAWPLFSTEHIGWKHACGFPNSVRLRSRNKSMQKTIHNHGNESVRNIGQGETPRRKYERLELGGGQVPQTAAVASTAVSRAQIAVLSPDWQRPLIQCMYTTLYVKHMKFKYLRIYWQTTKYCRLWLAKDRPDVSPERAHHKDTTVTVKQ
jgi:hypothetical protein